MSSELSIETISQSSMGDQVPDSSIRQEGKVMNGIWHQFPQLERDWHPQKNTISKDCVTSTSEIWWQCGENGDHAWLATVYERGKRRLGCPFCPRGNFRIPKKRTLAHRFPEIARQWHPTKNGNLTPEVVGASSDRTVWWVCDKSPEHEWRGRIDKRTLRNQPRCPECPRIRTPKSTRKKRLPKSVREATNVQKVHNLRLETFRALNIIPRIFSRFSEPAIARRYIDISKGLLDMTDSIDDGTILWWQCPYDQTHAWQDSFKATFEQDGLFCPYCRRNFAKKLRNRQREQV